MKSSFLNDKWNFYKAGEERKQVELSLPHDAMIYEKRNPNCMNAYDTGYYPGGSYVYKKELSGLEFQHGLIEFDGVFGVTAVFLNGKKLKSNVYGYTNFFVELDDCWEKDGNNVLEVRVDNSIETVSRWYTGSGIYRDVMLYTSGKYYIDPEAVFLSTQSVEGDAEITARIGLGNKTAEAVNAAVRITFQDQDKKVSVQEQDIILEPEGICCEMEIRIPSPRLWTAETPALYEVDVELSVNGETVDTHEEMYGIRRLEWNAEGGFKVNGTTVKLLGGCVHHDNGMLGAVTTKSIEYRKVKLLKEAGFNAVRSAHNPTSKAFLQACDELGLYVMDESFDVWYNPKGENVFQYSKYFNDWWKYDTQAMVRRDYNHPSVIMYSVGNEIFETAFPKGIETAKMMREEIRELDVTRPVTCCVNLFMNMTAKSGDQIPVDFSTAQKPPKYRNYEEEFTSSKQFNVIMGAMNKLIKHFVGIRKVDYATREVCDAMDIAGYNYGIPRYSKDKKLHPERLIVGSETVSCEIDENYKALMENDNVVGDFVWTAMDHLGESGIGILDYKDHAFYKKYPCILNGCGVIGLNGVFHPMAYLTQITFGKRHKPYIIVEPFGHEKDKLGKSSYNFTNGIHTWDFAGQEGKKSSVYVLTDAKMVELYLNGKRIAVKKRGNRLYVRFTIKYASGELETRALDETGNVVGSDKVFTPENTVKLSAIPECDWASAGDIIYIPVELQDENGVLKNDSNKKVEISVCGAKLLAFGSENPFTEENYHDTKTSFYQGKALAIVKADYENSPVKITFTCDKCVENIIISRRG